MAKPSHISKAGSGTLDTFFSRKRKRPPGPPQSQPLNAANSDIILRDHGADPDGTTVINQGTVSEEEDDSTDLKLATLSSLLPDFDGDHSTLLEALLLADGDVHKASETLAEQLRDSKLYDSRLAAQRKKNVHGAAWQSCLPWDAMNAAHGGARPRYKGNLVQKGRTLHLFSPEDVERHTPCSLIINFLPAELANGLLRELLDEASGGGRHGDVGGDDDYVEETDLDTYKSERRAWHRAKFQLFDRTVQSPHTSCFYVSGGEREAREQKEEFRYNGGYVDDVRRLTPEMQRVSKYVEEQVNQEIQRRIRDVYPEGKKLRYQSPKVWRPNTAFANCYDGGEESVGYHADQLTYLGPRPTIGSLSLGVTREFRVRRIIRKDPADRDSGQTPQLTSPQKSTTDTTVNDGQIAIHLPHNSLLVMHAEMQEDWKHAIAPAKAITPHPIGGRKRINVTYRSYRPSLHPRYTPKCQCEVPVVLRAVRKGYAWMCFASYVPGKKGCTFFRLADFDDDGEPPWAGEVEGRVDWMGNG